MDETKRKLKSRKVWIQAFEKFGSVSKASRYCGIPRSTLYRWLQRYKLLGEEGLKDKSRKPKKLAKLKVSDSIVELIIKIRKQHRFGPKRISIHLARQYQIDLSPATIWRVLQKQDLPLIRRYRKTSDFIRYNRPIPGDRVQVDVMKVRGNCYQFTAIDDCTRLRVLRLYPRKTAGNAILFFYEMLESFPFPIQRIQSDWGTEFFNTFYQEELIAHYVKFRPIKPRSPHLNGKVERSQQTDKIEFYSLINLKDKSLELKDLLAEWEHFYNHKRPHTSLNGKTPWEKFEELEPQTPLQGDVTQMYWDEPEEGVKPRCFPYLKLKANLSHIS